jgi:hypothetical protein
MSIFVALAGLFLIVAGLLLFAVQRLGLIGLLAVGAILFGLRKRDREKVLILIPPEAGSSWRLAESPDGLHRSRFNSPRGRFAGPLLILIAIAFMALISHVHGAVPGQ